MSDKSEDGRSGVRTSDNTPVATRTRKRWSHLNRAAPLAAFLLSVTAIRADETNTVAQSLCIGNGSIITNVAQIAAAFDQPGLAYGNGISPWEPGMFEGQQVWFADFDQLPQGFGALRDSTGYVLHGVTFSGLTLVLDAVTGAVTAKDPFSDTVLFQFDPPANYQPYQRYDQELQRFCSDQGMASMTYAELIQNDRYSFLDPPILVLEVWLASLSDCATYESNVAADLAAELATDAAEAEYAGQGVNAARTMAEAKGGSMMMLMDNGDPCTITNEADPFSIVTVMMDEQGCTVTWQSCSDHIYGVYSTEEMSDTNVWTLQQWMWGGDGTTSWADRNAAAYPARFYKVVRANPDALNNGVPYGWAVDNGFDPLDPNLATDDPDGDGQSNYAEYVAGTDPNDPTSYFHVTSIVLVGNDVWVYFTSVSGKYYDLQRYDFSVGGWTNVVENIPGNGGIQGAKDIGGISGSGWYRVVVLQLSSPPPADSDYDGIPDLWMEQYFGHPAGLAADNSTATDDADGDGWDNLEEYLNSTNPLQYDSGLNFIVNAGQTYSPSLTVTIQPQSTNYPNVLVSLDPSMSNPTVLVNSDGAVLYTPPDNGDGGYELFLRYADAQGQPHGPIMSKSIIVDRTPPVVYITSPASTAVLSQAFITLEAVAYDPNPVLADASRPLGIWINNQPFWEREGTNVVVNLFPVPLGSNSFTVTIQAADMAGHTNQAMRTWTVDTSSATNAPTLLTVNIPSTMLLPDMDSVWVEGDIDNGNALVSALVSSDSGGVTTNALNLWKQHYEGLVPLESGTNQMVLLAANATGNTSSMFFTIIRSTRYQAAITSPAFGEFATSPSNTVSGYVSTNFDAGLPTETNVVGVTINGVAAVLGSADANGNIPFTSAQMIPLGEPITGEISGPGIPTDPPPSIPPAMSQVYEVTHRETVHESILAKQRPCLLEDEYTWSVWTVGRLAGTACWNNGWCSPLGHDVSSETRDLMASTGGVQVESMSRTDYAWCFTELNPDRIPWRDMGTPATNSQTVSGPIGRGLSMGTYLYDHGSGLKDTYRDYFGHCMYQHEIWEQRALRRELDSGRIEFRAPRQYGTNTTVIFTFEGVDYRRREGAALDLSHVKFRGQTPVAYSNEIKTVSYLLSVDGGKGYTICEDDFEWPADQQFHHETASYQNPGACPSIKAWSFTGTWAEDMHCLSWTNFHNAAVQIREHDVGVGGYGADLKQAAKKLNVGYSRYNNLSYAKMLAQIHGLGQFSCYVYLGHGSVDTGQVTIAGYTGVECKPENEPYCYDDGFLQRRLVAYPYVLTNMLSDFKNGKGVPRIVIVGACHVDEGNAWQSQFTGACAKLVVSTGGLANVAAETGALHEFFNALSEGKTVQEALDAGNVVIDADNRDHGGQTTPLTPTYGAGITGTNKFTDLLKE